MSAELIEWIPIYYADRKPGRGPANGSIKRDIARELVDAGLAKWTKKANALVLTKKEYEVKIRDHSCQMGPRVIMQAADGDPFFTEIVNAWKPKLAA